MNDADRLPKMRETEVTIEAGDAVLSGSLCEAVGAGPVPCVLMLPGSGPLDRNENVPGQRLDIFNAIARHLAAAGFASLRYDKRGCGSSNGDYLRAGYFDFVEDAIACFDSLKRHPRCNGRIYLLGHSEGTVTAMHVSLQRPEVAGIIQLCPTAENFESTLMRQAAHLRDVLPAASETADPVTNQKNLLERVKAGQAEPHEVELHHIGLKWFREVLDLDVPGLYAKMRHPMLLIAGAKDVQCHAAALPTIRGMTSAPIEIVVMPDLTHLLRSDREPASILRYPMLMHEPLEPLVLQLISRWLSGQPH